MLRFTSLTPYLFVMLTLVASCSDSDNSSPAPQDTVDSLPSVAQLVTLRPLSVSEDLRIVDDLDREVLLRGVNLNSLGEYWQGDPNHQPTIAVGMQDWQEMAARGISVVRLVVNWSKLEPQRGAISDAYLDEIDETVSIAAAHGIYTVIDMHQDAFSAFIYTEDADECSPGTQPGKGWDGAPQWATLTDGLSTCITGERNSAPAVIAAWNHFYNNTDGIADRFIAVWGAIAKRFAGRPEVAGYDLLNEPEVSRPATELQPIFEGIFARAIETIRQAQEGQQHSQLIFIEPGIAAAHPEFGLLVPQLAGVDRHNIVAGPHNYSESIGTGFGWSIEETTDVFLSFANLLGVPIWVGEYGFWDTSESTVEKAKRLAADQDDNALGGAQWQWRQACGDPHSLSWGGVAVGRVVHLNAVDCPGDVDAGPTEVFMRILSRTYPRMAPGRITLLHSDSDTGDFRLEASIAPADRELIVWSPTYTDTHIIESEGLVNLTSHPVAGGRIIKALTIGGDYTLILSSRPEAVTET